MDDLAAIIAEGESKIALYDRVGCHKNGQPAVIVSAEVLSRLLAVAKAAVEMRRSVTLAQEREWAAKLDALIEDAAVRGDEGGEG